MKVRQKILVPFANIEVIQRGDSGLPLDDAFLEATALAVFRKHRGNPGSKVLERLWDGIPNSERGKYRKIVREAIARFRRNQKTKRVPVRGRF